MAHTLYNSNLTMSPKPSLKNRKAKAASILLAAYRILSTPREEKAEKLIAILAPYRSTIRKIGESTNHLTVLDQYLLTIKLESFLTKVEPHLGNYDDLTEQHINDLFAQTETIPPPNPEFEDGTEQLRTWLYVALTKLAKQPAREANLLKKRAKQALLEISDSQKQVRTKRIAATSSGISVALWTVILLYLILGLPQFLSFLPSGGSRDFRWVAFLIALIVSFLASLSRRKAGLNIKEMLGTILALELVLLISICYMSGLTPLDWISASFIWKWFLYLQYYLSLPWIAGSLIALYLFPDTDFLDDTSESKTAMTTHEQR